MAHQLCSKQSPPSKKEHKVFPKVNHLLGKISELSEEESHALICEMIKQSPCSNEVLKKQMNLIRDTITYRNKHKVQGETSSKVVCRRQRNDDPGATVASVVTKNDSAPASKVPMIIRGDLAEQGHRFFLDTEKVTEASTHKNVSGDLAIVDEKGRLVFWCYIMQTDVCKYNTKLTGLDEFKMKMGLDIVIVHQLLDKLFRGKTLVGADVINDFKSLGIVHPESIFNVEDIQDFYRDYKNDRISLAYLGEHFIGENVQGTTHSSITDARLTALCDRKMKKFKELGMERFECPVMDDLRRDGKKNPKNKQNIKWDRCTCGVKKRIQKRAVQDFRNFSFNLEEYMD